MCDECWCLTGLDKEGRPAALGGQVQVITELISDAVFKKLLWQMSSFCQGLNSSFAGREEGGDLSEGGRVTYQAVEKTEYHVEECRSEGRLMEDRLEREMLGLHSPQGSRGRAAGPHCPASVEEVTVTWFHLWLPALPVSS